jgi:hypothetical protein
MKDFGDKIFILWTIFLVKKMKKNVFKINALKEIKVSNVKNARARKTIKN